MSRINITSSKVLGDRLVVGWDPGLSAFFAMVDDDSDVPTHWAPRLDTIADTAAMTQSWGESIPVEVQEKLALHKLWDSEERMCFDLVDGRFLFSLEP